MRVTTRCRHERLLPTAAVLVLALMVVLAQPASSLAWLAGAHATPLQASFHEEAVEHGHTHHHGDHDHALDGARDDASRNHAAPYCGTCGPYAGPAMSGPTFIPAFAPAQLQGGFQDALKAVFGATLGPPSPMGERRHAPHAESAPAEHVPSVPHRPPISSPAV